MLPLLILGVIVALGLVLVLRWAVAVEPRQLLRVLVWTLGGLLTIGVLFLAVTGRLNWALVGLAALLPWIARVLRFVSWGRGLARLLASLGFSGGAGAARGFGGLGGGPDPDPGDRSEVTTRFFRMTLSHASGAMTGEVREGPYEGRALDDLSRTEALSLWQQVQADPESARVFDAWLDRVHPDWREAAEAGGEAGAGGGANAGGTGGGPMTRAEALAVLGLEEGASPADIKAAHRRLIVLLHPDRGGTPYLAARLNQARDVLLGSHAR
ncbi:J domain-containing protein [Roseospira goensis]|uniref:J domain-containing protein n=1 Tax=Roseospira goensis TaxID=391922 RepID=A0A7W6RYT0_9PROT|nr:molecular chaperone DnaJ [Roseospira goensis]MBB4285741.1 hypothetical protein [Roseospira goensis]